MEISEGIDIGITDVDMLPCDDPGYRLYKVPAMMPILVAQEITYYLFEPIPITKPAEGEPEKTWSAKITVTGLRVLNCSKIEADPDAVKPNREPISVVLENCTFNVPAEEPTEGDKWAQFPATEYEMMLLALLPEWGLDSITLQESINYLLTELIKQRAEINTLKSALNINPRY